MKTGIQNAGTHKEIFKLIKENKLWLGYRNINKDMWLFLPEDEEKYEKIVDGKKMKHIMACWYTNIETSKRYERLDLYKKYTPEEYPKYDNYDAINVDKVDNIPVDYDGVMGVPITFLDKYNPNQFEIVAFRKGEDGKDLVFTRERERESSNILSYPCSTSIPGMIKNAEGRINGKITYARITIRKKQSR